MIRYIKTFEVIFSTNNLSGMHISTMWHSLNVLKYFCSLSVYRGFLNLPSQPPILTNYKTNNSPNYINYIITSINTCVDSSNFLLSPLGVCPGRSRFQIWAHHDMDCFAWITSGRDPHKVRCTLHLSTS